MPQGYSGQGVPLPATALTGSAAPTGRPDLLRFSETLAYEIALAGKRLS